MYESIHKKNVVPVTLLCLLSISLGCGMYHGFFDTANGKSVSIHGVLPQINQEKTHKKEEKPPKAAANEVELSVAIQELEKMLGKSKELDGQMSLPAVKMPVINIDPDLPTSIDAKMFVYRLKIHGFNPSVLVVTPPRGSKKRVRKGERISENIDVTFEGVYDTWGDNIPIFHFKGDPLYIKDLYIQ